MLVGRAPEDCSWPDSDMQIEEGRGLRPLSWNARGGVAQADRLGLSNPVESDSIMTGNTGTL
jgi:hypothetical protein